LVAEAGVVDVQELPEGWGLIEISHKGVEVTRKAIWYDTPDTIRWLLSRKIAETACDTMEQLLTAAPQRRVRF
jgi:hypothetical protein